MKDGGNTCSTVLKTNREQVIDNITLALQFYGFFAIGPSRNGNFAEDSQPQHPRLCRVIILFLFVFTMYISKKARNYLDLRLKGRSFWVVDNDKSEES